MLNSSREGEGNFVIPCYQSKQVLRTPSKGPPQDAEGRTVAEKGRDIVREGQLEAKKGFTVVLGATENNGLNHVQKHKRKLDDC